MFGKRKGWLTQELSDKTATVRDFNERGIYRGYRPSSYRINPMLEESEMLPKLDAHLKALFSGAIDDANGDVLNQLVFSEVRIGNQQLAEQRIGHRDTIYRLRARWESDCDDFKALREIRQKELQKAEEDHNATLEAMKKGGYQNG